MHEQARGQGLIAAGAATIAKVLFGVFLVIFVVIVLMVMLGVSIVA